MENFVNDVKKRLAKCTKWPQVFDVLKSGISPEHILHFLEILKEFSITDPEIKDVIETNLAEFLKQMKIVCYHIISEFYNFNTIDTKRMEFFTIHVKWFYVIFMYFALKRMVFQQLIVWQNFEANQNIEKMFIDALMKYERELPRDYYDRGLNPSFRILISFIIVSPALKLEGIGRVPECIYNY
jgi:hypothetical protein